MASFKTHVTFGIALGVAGMFSIAGLAFFPNEWTFGILLFLAIVVGAILPDMDSDSSVPFNITFGSLTLVAGGFALLYALRTDPYSYTLIVAAPLIAMGFVWYVVGTIFKKFTHHRGMAHSVPAAALSGLVIFTFTSRTGFTSWEAFFLGVAMSAGYILHLALDEAHAAVNFHGKPFIPNKSLGSAIKFLSNDRFANGLVYFFLILLLALNFDTLSPIFEDLSSRL